MLTKYNLAKEEPEYWLELQHCLLSPDWLLPHVSTWLSKVREESERKVSIQGSGGIMEYSGKGQGQDDAPLIDINSIVVSSHQNVNLIAYPTSDWSMIQRITTRFISKLPRVSLKILGFHDHGSSSMAGHSFGKDV